MILNKFIQFISHIYKALCYKCRKRIQNYLPISFTYYQFCAF